MTDPRTIKIQISPTLSSESIATTSRSPSPIASSLTTTSTLITQVPASIQILKETALPPTSRVAHSVTAHLPSQNTYTMSPVPAINNMQSSTSPLAIISTPSTVTARSKNINKTEMSQVEITEAKKHNARVSKTPVKQDLRSETISLFKGSKYRVSKIKLLEIYTPLPALYTVKLAELFFGKETIDYAAKASKTDALDLLDQNKMKDFISKYQVNLNIKKFLKT